MKRPRLFFEMPPIIGDPSTPHKKAIEVISVDFDSPDGALPHDLKEARGVNITLPFGHGSREFAGAFEDGKRYEKAILWIDLDGDKSTPLDTVYLEMTGIEIRGCIDYHGDTVVSLEFRDIKGQMPLAKIMKVLRSKPAKEALKLLRRVLK